MKAKPRRTRKTKGDRRREEVFGLLWLLLSIFGLIWYAHPSGVLGRAVASFEGWLLGSAGPVWLLGLLLIGVAMLRGGRARPTLMWASACLLIWWTALVSALGVTAAHSDNVGSLVVRTFDALLGPTGRDVLLIFWPLLVLSLTLRPFIGRTLRGAEHLAKTGARRVSAGVMDFVTEEVPDSVSASAQAATASPPATPWEDPPPLFREAPVRIQPEADAPAPINSTRIVPETSPAASIQTTSPLPVRHLEGYRLPPLHLLQAPERVGPQKRDGQARAQLLEETLRSFGVQARVLEYQQGPAVTRFEVQPGPGVKVSRIVGLADDIALAMAAADVRMEAPIPGKAAIGIEIPNGEVAPVRLREVLESPLFRDAPSLLTVGLGKDIAGRPIVAALDRMPHLLIAGATGSGKSVSLNALIASLLFRATPEEVRLLLIDPKVVELQQFDGIPHLLAPVVTDPKKAAGVLRGILREMEDRYVRFARAGCRDIQRYNEIGEEHLPYVVVVIDELADLMMVAPSEVEETICRLAQMARAAGIHLVVATQRPSVDVITGLIKANIPSRIAFAVSSQVDSRTILDQGGAERLLGKGDMLFAPLGMAKPVRAQGAYVSEQEMTALIDFVRQGAPDYREDLSVPIQEEAQAEDLDELFPRAVEVVVQAHSASASLLQRRMRVGYSRAARLIEQMEQKGIVGPPDGSKPREVRLSVADYERLFGERDE